MWQHIFTPIPLASLILWHTVPSSVFLNLFLGQRGCWYFINASNVYKILLVLSLWTSTRHCFIYKKQNEFCCSNEGRYLEPSQFYTAFSESERQPRNLKSCTPFSKVIRPMHSFADSNDRSMQRGAGTKHSVTVCWPELAVNVKDKRQMSSSFISKKNKILHIITVDMSASCFTVNFKLSQFQS